MEQKIELFPGVSLRGVTTGRFKSACLYNCCNILLVIFREEVFGDDGQQSNDEGNKRHAGSHEGDQVPNFQRRRSMDNPKCKVAQQNGEPKDDQDTGVKMR